MVRGESMFPPGRSVVYDREAEVRSLLDAEGGALTITSDVRLGADPGPDFALVVAGHRLGLEQVRTLEQALRYHREVLEPLERSWRGGVAR